MAIIINKAKSTFTDFSEVEIGGIFEFMGNYFIKAKDTLNGETFGVNLYSGIRREFSLADKLIPRYDTEIIIK
jgi:hypothetical protein